MTPNEIERIITKLLEDYPGIDIAAKHITEFIMGIKSVEKEYEEDKQAEKDYQPLQEGYKPDRR